MRWIKAYSEEADRPDNPIRTQEDKLDKMGDEIDAAIGAVKLALSYCPQTYTTTKKALKDAYWLLKDAHEEVTGKD